jgi:ATP-dependent Clp protease ATP-binding subunit ClpA
MLDALISQNNQTVTTMSRIDGEYQLTLSAALNTVLNKSQQLMKSMGDQYVTTEHLLLAIVQ